MIYRRPSNSLKFNRQPSKRHIFSRQPSKATPPPIETPIKVVEGLLAESATEAYNTCVVEPSFIHNNFTVQLPALNSTLQNIFTSLLIKEMSRSDPSIIVKNFPANHIQVRSTLASGATFGKFALCEMTFSLNFYIVAAKISLK